MRHGVELGYNIIYAKGDTVESAVVKLRAEMRECFDNFEVDLIGGLSLKEDAKNQFNVVQAVMLKEKAAALPGPEPEDGGAPPAAPEKPKRGGKKA